MHVPQRISTLDRKVASVRDHGTQDKELAPVPRTRNSESIMSISGSASTRPRQRSRDSYKASKGFSASQSVVLYPLTVST